MTSWKAGPVVAAVALVLAGCGGGGGDGDGGDDGRLTKAELVEQANAICKASAEEGRKLGRPNLADPATAEDYFNRARDLAQRQQDDLDALVPPAAQADDLDALVSSLGEATTLLDELAAAGAAGDQAKIAELVQQLTPVSAEVDEAANALGTASCAAA